MDSTFITLRDVAIEQKREIPVYYYPQMIGTRGGDIMWSGDSTHLDYPTYSYRIPSPQEFLLNCNLALMRGAVALFPYCLRSYSGTTANGDSYFTVGYLDNNNMPFDAPYEEWVYTDRWRSDYDVIPPTHSLHSLTHAGFVEISIRCGTSIKTDHYRRESHGRLPDVEVRSIRQKMEQFPENLCTGGGNCTGADTASLVGGLR